MKEVSLEERALVSQGVEGVVVPLDRLVPSRPVAPPVQPELAQEAPAAVMYNQVRPSLRV